MPPPRRLRANRASAITSSGPRQQRADGGAQALGQAAHDRGGRRSPREPAMPVAATVWNRRAPSMWIGTGPAASATASRRPRPGAPDAAMCVFSRLHERNRRLMVRCGQSGPGTSAAPIMPSSSSTAMNCTPAFRAAAPNSYDTTCWRRPATTAEPGAARIRRAIWFPITPEGTNSAAGLPTRREGLLQRSHRGVLAVVVVTRPRPRPWRGAWPGWAG